MTMCCRGSGSAIKSRTPTHVDEWNNIGCVVAGRRRFTLFPPEQIANLYIGPLDFAPTGAPMSLVSLRNPDFARYPKFREALAAAHVAELGPGDAIFIPPLWWHHVESLEPFNVLVNYWWHDTVGDGARGFGLRCVVARDFEHPRPAAGHPARLERFVRALCVRPGAGVVEHIPPERHGMLGELSPEQQAALRAHLMRRLGR